MARRSLRIALALSAVLSLGVARQAQAALTDSERAQVKTLVAGGEMGSAGKVRSLVGRPDLSEDEAAGPLVEGLRPTPFDAKHEAFLHELLFGPASQASRTSLVAPTVRALLARAESVMSAHPSDLAEYLASHLATQEELVRIHAFVDKHVANAGKPPAEGHDAAASIRDDALKSTVAAYRAHVELESRWLQFKQPVASSAAPLRAQVAVTLADLASGLSSRKDVADWLALAGARRSLFERAGTIVEDGARASEARVAGLVRTWESVPAAVPGVGLLYVDKRPPRGVSARGEIAAARFLLADKPLPIEGDKLWPDAVEPSRPDTGVAEAALEAARIGTSRVLAARAVLAAQADKALARVKTIGDASHLAIDLLDRSLDRDATGGGQIHATPALFVAHGVRLLLVDAPRATELALARSLGGRNEPLEQLALALAVLAAPADATAPLVATAQAGVTRDDGTVEPLAVTQIHVGPAGLVDSFVLEGHKVELTWADGAVTGAKRDGKAPTLATLPRARVPTLAGEQWTDGATIYSRIFGKPRVGIADRGHVTVVAAKDGDGFDAVTLGAPEGDVELEADVKVKEAAGLGLRATPGPSSYQAALLLVTPGAPAKGQLIAVDGTSHGTELSKAVDLPPPGPNGWHVVLTLRGQTLAAKIGDASLEGTLPVYLARGGALLTPRAGGELALAGLSVGKPSAARAGKPTAPKQKAPGGHSATKPKKP